MERWVTAKTSDELDLFVELVPYDETRNYIKRVLSSVAARVDSSIHPFLAVRETHADSRTLVIVVTADKGLCGSFNTNVIKGAGAFITTNAQPCTLGLVGRKGREFFGRRGFNVHFEQIGIFQKLKFEDARVIARLAIAQRLVTDQLLPIAPAGVAAGGPPAPKDGDPQVDYLYEPTAQQIFDQLLPRYVEVQVYRALLESNAAFFAAQMTAMDTATKNSSEMISSLTLYLNKVRQAAITREIIEVVSGAQAL